jgi:hypothetical protein
MLKCIYTFYKYSKWNTVSAAYCNHCLWYHVIHVTSLTKSLEHSQKYMQIICLLWSTFGCCFKIWLDLKWSHLVVPNSDTSKNGSKIRNEIKILILFFNQLLIILTKWNSVIYLGSRQSVIKIYFFNVIWLEFCKMWIVNLLVSMCCHFFQTCSILI